MVQKALEERKSIVIRFAGDSGDGMQLTGSQFTTTSAIVGNDISNLPDFPAEIRAPAGTLPGVSGFQLHFSSESIYTPGDEPDVLVAMNPAALKKNLRDLPAGGILIVNTDAFNGTNLKKAGYDGKNPLEDAELRRKFQVYEIPLTTLNRKALEDIPGITTREIDRCKNFFALGLAYWMFNRPMEPTLEWIESKFGKRREIADSNTKALRAGFYYGETTESMPVRYEVRPATSPPGTYRNISGNEAAALGFIAAANRAGKPLFYATYPITPASDILHELSRHPSFDVKTFQAEDEIAAMGAAIGGAFGGAFALTGTSGPGICLKSEGMGLAIMLELPLVIANIQRAGPSTGMPTKIEQSDLLQVMFGRNGESPIPIVAPATPGDCFWMAIECMRIAVKHMTPVVFLSDGYLATGAEPWPVPSVEDVPKIEVFHRTDPVGFMPYMRDEKTLARPWILPGTPGLEHRIGGLEKQEGTGNVSYDADNHERMCQIRAEKVARIADDIPDLAVAGAPSGKVLVLGWGSTYGAIRAAVETLQREGYPVSQAHLKYLNPFPKNLGDVLSRFERVLVPELNLGQLRMLVRARFLVDAIGLSKMKGQPFTVRELRSKVLELLGVTAGRSTERGPRAHEGLESGG